MNKPTSSEESGGMANPYPEGSGEHLLFAIFGELPGPDACECGMPTPCPPSPTAGRDDDSGVGLGETK